MISQCGRGSPPPAHSRPATPRRQRKWLACAKTAHYHATPACSMRHTFRVHERCNGARAGINHVTLARFEVREVGDLHVARKIHCRRRKTKRRSNHGAQRLTIRPNVTRNAGVRAHRLADGVNGCRHLAITSHTWVPTPTCSALNPRTAPSATISPRSFASAQRVRDPPASMPRPSAAVIWMSTQHPAALAARASRVPGRVPRKEPSGDRRCRRGSS